MVLRKGIPLIHISTYYKSQEDTVYYKQYMVAVLRLANTGAGSHKMFILSRSHVLGPGL